jgi:hypothetical protein
MVSVIRFTKKFEVWDDSLEIKQTSATCLDFNFGREIEDEMKVIPKYLHRIFVKYSEIIHSDIFL